MRPLAVLRVAVLASFLCGLVWGQSSSSLRGIVSDPQGAVLVGAKVTLSNPSTGFAQSTTTDNLGSYQFLQTPPGTYALTVSMAGFATMKQENLALQVNVPSTANVTMKVMAETSIIDVQSQAVQVNSEDATLGNAFGTQQIESLPFEGRDPTQILSLQPGVTFVGTNVDQNQDSRGGSVSGARSDQTNITLDGVDDNDQVKGYAFAGALRSTLDSLQEFRVTTSSANADQGRSSGAQVALITKGGTNSFHGSVYEYNRNNVGEANDWFNKQSQIQSGLPNVPGQLIRNTFGATFGGPIVKNKIFFFLAYEGQRTRENAQITRVVPSDDLRQGIISYDCTGDPKCPAGGVESLTKQDLAKTDPKCTGNGTCPLGPGANPAVMSLFQQYPHPNSTAVGDGLNFQGFTFPASTPGMLNTYVAKFDFNISQNHHVFIRGGLVDDNNGAGPQFPGQPQSSVTVNNSKGLITGYTATLRPNLINNFHYGYIRQGIGSIGQLTQDYIVFGNGPDSLNADTFTTQSNVPVHNLTDDVAWVKGKHTFGFGGNLRIITNNRSSDANSFSYARSYDLWLTPTAFIAGTGSSLDPGGFGFPAVNPAFQTGYDWPVMALTGLLDSSFSNYNITKAGVAQPTGSPALRHFRAHEFEMYAQDSWRATPQLTLTYGVRYTLLQPPYETTGTQVAPSISLESFLQNRAKAMLAGQPYNPPISYVLSGQANGKAPYWNWDYGNFAPRLAFAWSPKADSGWRQRLFGGSGKSAIRGGYGIYYDHFGQGVVDSFDRNGSFGLTTTIPNPIGQYTINTSPRFSGLNTIPPALIAKAPTGGFPKLAPSGLPDGVANSWGVDDKMKTPYAHVFDFSISRELPSNFVVDVAYIGRLGRRLLQEEDFAMPLDIVDKQSGMDYFKAATLLSKAAAAGTPIQSLAKIPYFEDMWPGAAGVYDAADFGECTPGNATLPGNFSPSATQAMYSSYACALHNETLPLIFADIPGFLGSGPNPDSCFPACS